MVVIVVVVVVVGRKVAAGLVSVARAPDLTEILGARLKGRIEEEEEEEEDEERGEKKEYKKRPERKEESRLCRKVRRKYDKNFNLDHRSQLLTANCFTVKVRKGYYGRIRRGRRGGESGDPSSEEVILAVENLGLRQKDIVLFSRPSLYRTVKLFSRVEFEKIDTVETKTCKRLEEEEEEEVEGEGEGEGEGGEREPKEENIGNGRKETLMGKLADEVMVVLEKVKEEHTAVDVNMLQTIPKVPFAGVKRRWGGSGKQYTTKESPHHNPYHHYFQHQFHDCCSEVSSSSVLSPSPSSYRSETPETPVYITSPDSPCNDNLIPQLNARLWDLDLHRGLLEVQNLQRQQQQQQTSITTGSTTTGSTTTGNTTPTTTTNTTIDQYNRSSTVVAPNTTTASSILITAYEEHPASPYQTIAEEIVEHYNLKSSESTHVGSNDLEYISQDAGITCNKHIVQKQSSFIEVFKDYKRTITPPANTINKAQKKIKGNTSNNITLQNRVNDSDNSESSEENKENAKIATKAKVPPPLIMHGKIQSHQRFQELLKQNLKSKFFIKYKKERVELHTSTLEDFNHIKEKWARDNIKFHTYTTKSEKRKTYVIYGMHHGITAEDIKIELEDRNIVVYNVNAMRSTSKPIPSNVSNRLDNSSNNQNVTSTDVNGKPQRTST
ncbi:hypothetical protein M0802_009978 [Mischocyttarus mexicanus]|nr:hypothetical protein M0802_009978 [Mischocyttarus mexicanus]